MSVLSCFSNVMTSAKSKESLCDCTSTSILPSISKLSFPVAGLRRSCGTELGSGVICGMARPNSAKPSVLRYLREKFVRER